MHQATDETRVDTAISSLAAAVETQPAVATNYLDLARCYYTLRRRSDAVVALARGLELVRKARATDQRESSGGTSATAPAAEAPGRIKDVSPDYPDDAARTRVTGMVIVEDRIHGMVLVRNAQVIRSVPMLDDAALRAVRQWHTRRERVTPIRQNESSSCR